MSRCCDPWWLISDVFSHCTNCNTAHLSVLQFNNKIIIQIRIFGANNQPQPPEFWFLMLFGWKSLWFIFKLYSASATVWIRRRDGNIKYSEFSISLWQQYRLWGSKTQREVLKVERKCASGKVLQKDETTDEGPEKEISRGLKAGEGGGGGGGSRQSKKEKQEDEEVEEKQRGQIRKKDKMTKGTERKQNTEGHPEDRQRRLNALIPASCFISSLPVPPANLLTPPSIISTSPNKSSFLAWEKSLSTCTKWGRCPVRSGGNSTGRRPDV